MARFSTRGLGLLDRLYQFAAGSPSAPINFDVASPIQPVHDMARQAELGAVDLGRFRRGFLQWDMTNVHGAADSQETSIDVFNTINNAFGQPQPAGSIWAWLWHAGLISDGVLSSAALSIGTAEIMNVLIARWADSVQINEVGSFDRMGIASTNAAGDQNPYVERLPFPILSPFSSIAPSLRIRTTSTGAGTIQVFGYMWVGPVGVFPPGLA